MGRTPVDKPRIQNKDKQKEIAQALFPHFMQAGIKSLSTEMMCEYSGKSKATLYKYFESKYQMVEYIIANRLKEFEHFETLLFDNSKSYKQRYQNAVEITVKSVDGISPLFLKETKEVFPDLFEGILGLKTLALQLLTSFYNEGIQAGIFIELPADLMVMNDDLFFTAILESDFLEKSSSDLKTIFEAYFTIRFNGILSS